MNMHITLVVNYLIKKTNKLPEIIFGVLMYCEITVLCPCTVVNLGLITL